MLTRQRARSLNIDISQIIDRKFNLIEKRQIRMPDDNQNPNVANAANNDINNALVDSLQHSRFLELASKRLIPFSGKIGSEILTFFDDFESLAKATNVPDNTKLNILPLFLDSFPRSVLNNLRSDNNSDYAEIKRQIIGQFLPPGHEDRAIIEFQDRMQRESESIDEYIHNLRKMATRAYPSMSADDLKVQLKVSFIKGLLNRYRPQVMMFGMPKTLDEAIERAKNFEYMSGEKNIQFPGTNEQNKVQHDMDNAETSKLVRNLTQTIDELRSEITELKLRSRKPSSTEVNYVSNNYRRTYSPNNSNSKSKFEPKKQYHETKNIQEKEFKCYECGKKGHFGRDCWHRKRRLESVNNQKHESRNTGRDNKSFSNRQRNRSRSSERSNNGRQTFTTNSVETHKSILRNSNNAIYIDSNFTHDFKRIFRGMASATMHYRKQHYLSQRNTCKFRSYYCFRTDVKNVNGEQLHRKPASKVRFVVTPQEKLIVTTTKPIKKAYTSLPLVDLEVNNVPIRALVDCGSQITLITKEFVENSLQICLPKISSSESGLSVNGSSFNILATLPFDVKIGENMYEIPIGVVNRLPYTFLIGNDVIKEYGIDIIQSENHLAIGDEKIEIVSSRNYTHESNNSKKIASREIETTSAIVCFTKSIKLPPMSECIVPCSVMSNKPSQELLFEANETFCGEHKIFAATTLVKSYDSIIPCRILNSTKKPVILEAAKIIGSATENFEIANYKSTDTTPEKELMAEIKLCISKACVSERDRMELERILLKNQKLFAQTNRELGKTSMTKHKIRTGDAKPVKGRKFRTPYAYRETLKKTIDEMLMDKIITPSRSEWSNPIFLVKKKDGTMRPVVDYRELNKVTEPDVYPIPKIDEYLDCLGKAKIFTTLDLKSGYWQIAMDEQSKEKTAFSSPFGNFNFEVMPFGVRNAPSEFCRLMDIVLANLQWKTALVYIDDIIIFSETFEEHKRHIAEVFEALEAANLKLKLSKCNFCQEKVTFLGHVISQNGVEPDRNKISDVINHSAPTSQKELQKFLGLVQ